MVAKLKSDFEKKLKEFLSEKFSEAKGIRVLKNGISIKLGKSIGRIGFSFLNNMQGYNLSESVSVPEIKKFFEMISPPYRPNFSTDFELVMNTSMETRYRQFSSTGTINLPRNEKEQEKACEYIYHKIDEIYMPRIVDLINADKKVIDDILRFPLYYKYPFLTIFYIIKKNNLKSEDINLEAVLSKRMKGNIPFNKMLLENYFQQFEYEEEF